MNYSFSDIAFYLDNNRRAKLINEIHVMDVKDGKALKGYYNDSPKYYYLKKIYELDFVQEISGFFHSRKRCYIHEGMEEFVNENVPNDVEIKLVNDSYSFVAAGDYVVDNDLNVYRVYGWDNEHNSELYWDYLDGSGSEALKRKSCCNGNNYYMTNLAYLA